MPIEGPGTGVFGAPLGEDAGTGETPIDGGTGESLRWRWRRNKATAKAPATMAIDTTTKTHRGVPEFELVGEGPLVPVLERFTVVEIVVFAVSPMASVTATRDVKMPEAVGRQESWLELIGRHPAGNPLQR